MNGVAQRIFRVDATDSAIGLDPFQFAVNDTDTVQLCQRVVYADGTDTGYSCRFVNSATAPPQPVYDFADGTVFPILDAQLCPVLEAAAGSYPGGVVIKSDGDVYLPGTMPIPGPIYDCPAYGSAGSPINRDNAPSATVYWLLPPTA